MLCTTNIQSVIVGGVIATNEGVWSVFHGEVCGSCLARFLLVVHAVRVGVSHLQEVQGSCCVACRWTRKHLTMNFTYIVGDFPYKN